MRSFEFALISAHEYDEFAKHAPYANFQQTSAMARVREDNGSRIAFTAVKEEGKIVAAALLAIQGTALTRFASVTDGPLCDFDDVELTRFFLSQLAAYAKKQGAVHFDMTPEQTYQVLSSQGHELDGDDPDVPRSLMHLAKPDRSAIVHITDNGFTHEGLSVGYTPVPRWRYVKDLTPFADVKSLLASYAKNTRRNVKIADNSCVEVRQLGESELNVFHDICELSSERQGFTNRSLTYAQQIFESFGDDAQFMIAEIHLQKYIKVWQKKLDVASKQVEELEAEQSKVEASGGQLGDKKLNKLRTARQNAEAAVNRIAKAKQYVQEDGDVVPVAAALFIVQPREMVYLMSGSNDKYAKFYAPTALQHYAMSWCVEHGIDRYNFYGISGYFDDPQAEGAGVLEFKQGFNGYVEELMGSFSLVLRGLTYRLQRVAHKILGR
ncbi:aminoacyltransferase [Bifidobacterium gallicum]|uniref:FemAB family protein n=1 Tax=Bifidobacterium gallicum DSM 20093 = LMG 11596 TaxID=561180 RepID=D1NUD0_9BIFI|nr:aminoacyltransferase [Bifidobacterium gallicum]EFA23334.1 FemAB family protein [Bifidobacterium gallicum DSM 20093 = LMG 11596]KFI57903.1 FmhC protein [Bifidobacterium gallicum DSM 20093 = LMG 11596]